MELVSGELAVTASEQLRQSWRAIAPQHENPLTVQQTFPRSANARPAEFRLHKIEGAKLVKISPKRFSQERRRDPKRRAESRVFGPPAQRNRRGCALDEWGASDNPHQLDGALWLTGTGRSCSASTEFMGRTHCRSSRVPCYRRPGAGTNAQMTRRLDDLIQ